MKKLMITGAVAMAVALSMPAPVRADDDEVSKDKTEETGIVVVSDACVPFTEASEYESKAKEEEEKAKEEEEKAKEQEEKAKEEDEAKGDLDAAREHEEKAKEHEEKAKEHEEKAKDHEDKAESFEHHEVPAGATECVTPGGVPGFLPAGANSNVGTRAYRELHGE